MYRAFYGLRHRPFTKTPDPRYLYLSPGHREALARLQYVVEEREMALLTGEIGCGKTTLSRALMDIMGEGYRFCFIFNPRLTALEFLRNVARGLQIENPPLAKDDLLQSITDTLYLFFRRGVCPVLIIDEAQLIPDREIFDEIRLLTNFQLDDRNLLSVIIMGQPELRRILAAPSHEPLRQRLAISYHLRPLSLPETLDYIDFRIERAGGVPGLFSPDAIRLIHDLSGGIPRKINILATNALLVGFHRDATMIDASHIDEIRNELL
jgi:type II secretory pathway predicted ATPase ExeA